MEKERKLNQECYIIFYFLYPQLLDEDTKEANILNEDDLFKVFKKKTTKDFQQLSNVFKRLFNRDLFPLLEKMENKKLFDKIIFYIGLNSMPFFKRMFCKFYLFITNKKPYLNYEKTI